MLDATEPPLCQLYRFRGGGWFVEQELPPETSLPVEHCRDVLDAELVYCHIVAEFGETPDQFCARTLGWVFGSATAVIVVPPLGAHEKAAFLAYVRWLTSKRGFVIIVRCSETTGLRWCAYSSRSVRDGVAVLPLYRGFSAHLSFTTTMQ